MPAIERSSGSCARLVAGAVAAQQLDLHRVHRVDVGVAQIDRAAQDRLALEQPRRRPSRRARRRRARSCSSSIACEERSGRGRAEVAARDRQARLRERHLEVVDDRAEERQPLVEVAQRRVARLRERGAAAEPRRQQHAVLRPGEHPRDRAERGEVVGVVRPARRARRDLEQRQLVDRRERAEELARSRRPPRRTRDRPPARRRPGGRAARGRRPKAARAAPPETSRAAFRRAPPRDSAARALRGRT